MYFVKEMRRIDRVDDMRGDEAREFIYADILDYWSIKPAIDPCLLTPSLPGHLQFNSRERGIKMNHETFSPYLQGKGE